MNNNEIMKKIKENYLSKCRENKTKINNNILLYLNEKIPENSNINIIYRGNSTVNYNNRISNDDLEMLSISYFDYASHIQNIDLSFNCFNDTVMQIFCRLLENCENLESLNLQFNEIKEKGGLQLFKTLNNMKKNKKNNIKYLNLNGCRIGSKGIMGVDVDEIFIKNVKSEISMFFNNNKKIEEFNISNNDIEEVGVIDLFTSFNPSNVFCNLKVLCFDSPLLQANTDVIAFHIGNTIHKNPNLQKLSLRKFLLNDKGIKIIMNQLSLNNTVLRVLDLSANRFTHKGIKYICNYLKTDICSLESLILNANRTTDYGIKYIKEALKINKSLIHLDLQKNEFSDEGLALIAEELMENETLVSLKLFGNKFGKRSIEAFNKLLNYNNIKRQSDWFFDFTTYTINNEVNICVIENELLYDIYPETKYYIESV